MFIFPLPMAVFLFLFSSGPAPNPPSTFNGMVSKVDSSHCFDIGPRQVNWKPGVTQIYEMDEAGKKVDAPIPQVVHFGSYLHVDGKFDKATGDFFATAIQFLEPDSRQLGKISGIGLIEEAPHLHASAAAVTGTLWVDGYPLHVDPQTKLLSAGGKPFPASSIVLNTWAAYDAVRQPDGSIKTNSIIFAPNTISPGEVKYRDKHDPKITLPDYDSGKPGKIKFHYHWSPSIPWSLKILPDRATQEYVSKIGESLIPEYQRNLPPSDPAKIHFRFYVVEQPSKWKESLCDISGTSDGTIIVPDNVLATLDNEAQLAALLSNGIAATLEKQFYLHRKRTNLQNAVGWAGDMSGLYGIPVEVSNGIEAGRLWLRINELASRIGLRYMLRQSYDIRQAAFAWSAAANQRAGNPEHTGFTPSPLAASIIADLYFDYGSVDYSNLKTKRADYQRMLKHLRSIAPKLPVPKNNPSDSGSRTANIAAH